MRLWHINVLRDGATNTTWIVQVWAASITEAFDRCRLAGYVPLSEFGGVEA